MSSCIATTPSQLRDGVRGPIVACRSHLGTRCGLTEPVAIGSKLVIRYGWAVMFALGFGRTPARLVTNDVVGVAVVTWADAGQSHVALDAAQAGSLH